MSYRLVYPCVRLFLERVRDSGNTNTVVNHSGTFIEFANSVDSDGLTPRANALS
ncbi:hypothetical protein ACFSF3_24085 [Vibrio chagasii]